LKPRLTAIDQQILDFLTHTRQPVTVAYIARALQLPLQLVSNRLSQESNLCAVIQRELCILRGPSNRLYHAWVYRLRNPELASQLVFGSKTCPKYTMLSKVE